jgi:hypothetical protein
MNNDRLEEKKLNAIKVHEKLVQFLDAHGQSKWSPSFTKIIEALKAGEFDQAVSLDKAIPRFNMGSFGDFYLTGEGCETDSDAQAKFVFLAGAQHKTIINIRVYKEYGLDNDLVDSNFKPHNQESKVKMLKKLR